MEVHLSESVLDLILGILKIPQDGAGEFQAGLVVPVHQFGEFAPAGVTWPAIREMIVRVHGLGAETLIVTDQSNKEAASMKGTRAIVLPSPPHRKSAVPEELYTPLPYIVPTQIMAACLAEEKGLNPDRPWALEKVTRTM